jgi:predicted RNase H-like nuclease (RuvC/YqgF family)
MIFGVDIASGSPHSRQAPSYSLIILDGKDKVAYHKISRNKLIRLIREKQPSIVAIDNFFELASDRKELVSLLRRLPPVTKLVQVTGIDRPESLVRLARRYGLSLNRFESLEEAEACAVLASNGVGEIISAFEDRTWIKVSRRRSPGRGGWSQNRYTRKIHGAVKGLAREVERNLREAGLEFTSKRVEGLGGYTRAEFVVEAPRERVHVSPNYYCDAQVRVEGIERPQLQFRPLSGKDYIIIGFDPGMTTGIAAIDLSGHLVDLISRRAMSSSDVIEWISSRGNPLIVASDVFPAPVAVEKVKRAFNAILFTPGMDMPANEKISSAKEFGFKNDHERDAIAAALAAFRKYKNKFLYVEKKVPYDIDPDEVKALVVKGYAVERAVAGLTVKPEIKNEDLTETEDKDVFPNLAALRRRNQLLMEQVRTLREYINEIKIELAARDAEMRKAYDNLEMLKDRTSREIKRHHEIKIRDKEIERLRAILRSERKFTKKLKKDLACLKDVERVEDLKGFKRLMVLETFSKDVIMKTTETMNIGQVDIVMLEDASGGGSNTADLLVERGIEVIITDSEMAPNIRDYLYDKGIPVFSSHEVPIRQEKGVAFVKPEDVEIAMAKWRERMKVRQAESRAEWLEGLIKEYRVERRRVERQKQKSA